MTSTSLTTPEAVSVSLTINGAHHALMLDPRVTLLDLLREHLDLTGTKKGCDHGQCGSCTVLVNRRRVNACLTLAVAHDGDEIGRAHVLTPVTDVYRMPSSACKKKEFK